MGHHSLGRSQGTYMVLKIQLHSEVLQQDFDHTGVTIYGSQHQHRTPLLQYSTVALTFQCSD